MCKEYVKIYFVCLMTNIYKFKNKQIPCNALAITSYKKEKKKKKRDQLFNFDIGG